MFTNICGVCVCPEGWLIFTCTGGSATSDFVEGVGSFDVHVVSAETGLVEEEGSVCSRATLEGYRCRLGGTGASRGGGEGQFADFATEGEEVSELL